MLKKILVPLDRSVLAEQAIGQAALIARRAHAAIDLVTVHVPFPFAGFTTEPWNDKEAAAEATYLETIQAELRSGSDVPASHVVLNGEPADHICLCALDIGADLIVMTTHGRTGLSRLWLGSVADAVVRHSAVPVLLLRPAKSSQGRTAARHPFKRILVPFDGSGLAADALGPATDLARAMGATMVLLRVVLPVPLMTAYDPAIPMAYQPMIPDEQATAGLAADVHREIEAIVSRLREDTGLDVSAEVVVDSRVADAILNFAHTHDVDLIAMSTHGRGATRWLLGSVADKVIRGCSLPVLLRRPAAVAARDTTLTEADIAAELPAVCNLP